MCTGSARRGCDACADFIFDGCCVSGTPASASRSLDAMSDFDCRFEHVLPCVASRSTPSNFSMSWLSRRCSHAPCVNPLRSTPHHNFFFACRRDSGKALAAWRSWHRNLQLGICFDVRAMQDNFPHLLMFFGGACRARHDALGASDARGVCGVAAARDARGGLVGLGGAVVARVVGGCEGRLCWSY